MRGGIADRPLRARRAAARQVATSSNATAYAATSGSARRHARVRDDTTPARSGLISDRKEHTSELQSLMRISYAVFCLNKKKHIYQSYITTLLQHHRQLLSKITRMN